MKDERINVKLPKAYKEKLSKLAARRSMSMSELIRHWIRTAQR